MTQTKNYQLQKPAAQDFYNVEDFNQNADKLDAAVFAKAGKPATATAGNLAVLTSTGDLGDSGKKPLDFLPATTKPGTIGAELAGAAAAVQGHLGTHVNDAAKHVTPAEKTRLAGALLKTDLVVSSTQPALQEGRIWIKVM